MRGTSLRVLSNLAANAGMRMRRYDFVAAYLQLTQLLTRFARE